MSKTDLELLEEYLNDPFLEYLQSHAKTDYLNIMSKTTGFSLYKLNYRAKELGKEMSNIFINSFNKLVHNRGLRIISYLMVIIIFSTGITLIILENK